MREMLPLAIVGTVLIVAINYGLALVGEPRSAWLFCDVLKVCG